MKKLLLLLIIPILLILSSVNVSASDYTDISKKLEPNHVSLINESGSIYFYDVYYHIYNTDLNSYDLNKYYFITSTNIIIYKGQRTVTNSYEIIEVNSPGQLPYTIITLRVSLMKTFVNSNYSHDVTADNYILKFFRDDSSLYVSYVAGTGSIEYNNGFNDGYNLGIEHGQQQGYNEGYQDGQEEGFNLGREEGYEEGLQHGRAEGYNEGYNKGMIEGSGAWGLLFSTMLGTFGAVLGIEIFPGLTIGMIAAVPLILGLLSFIIGVSKGGKQGD